MARCTGALLAIALLLMLGACPAPIRSLAVPPSSGDTAGLGTDTTAVDSASGGAYDPESQQPYGAGTGSPVGPQIPGTETPTQTALPTAAQVGPMPGASVNSAEQQAPQNAAGPQLPGATGPQLPTAPGVGPQQPTTTAQSGPLAPVQQAPQYGALDAENFMGDAPRDTVWGQPKPKLSNDALNFAGRWMVAVVHRQGEARMLENSAEWVLELGRDGSFYAMQSLGGQTWRQSGTWELNGMQLLLHSGPGGERSYELSQEMENICVLREPARETALFCVRERPGAKVGAVQAKYDTDFGVLNLRPAGPGHWRGSYGEPSGVLLLAQLGTYLVGTWEQAPSKGFALLELREGGFAGAWLYGKSVYFDGRWVGVAAQ